MSSIALADEISSLAIEHRDFAHLHQVHADRVVDVRFAAAADRIKINFDVRVLVVSHFLGVNEIVVRRARGRRRRHDR